MLTEALIAASVISDESVEPTYGPYGREKIMGIHYAVAFKFWLMATLLIAPVSMISSYFVSKTPPTVSTIAYVFAGSVLVSMFASYVSAASTASDYSNWVSSYYRKHPSDWDKWDSPKTEAIT